MGISGESRILLVEDNPADVFLIKEALRTHEVLFHLQWFADGERAAAYIEGIEPGSETPDLVLLDLNLPRMDGIEVLARIRSNAQLVRTPVAILTSSDSPHDRNATARLGVSVYIRKPPTLDEFMQVGRTIKKLLEPDRADDSSAR